MKLFIPSDNFYAIIKPMSGKIMIVGTGNVGSSIAYALLNQRTAVKELILTDIDREDAKGEVMDLSDALAVAPSYLKLKAGDYSDAKDVDICIITAGANQKPGETRTDLAKKNSKIIKEIVEAVMASGFDGIFLVVSNPVDTLAYLTYQYSGLPPERIIGSGTVLDSARLRYDLAKKLGVHPKSVHAYQVGEHGDSEFALWSLATIGGEKIERLVSKTDRTQIELDTRNRAYEIIRKKGATYYGIGSCVTQIVNCILNDEKRVLSVSNYDDNNEVYSGFPAVVGRDGVERRLELPIDEKEAIKLQRSANAIKATIQEVA